MFTQHHSGNRHPKERVQEMIGRRAGGADPAHQQKPDPGGNQPRHHGGIGKGHQQLWRPVDDKGFGGDRGHKQNRAAHQHLQADNHQDITPRRRPAHHQRGNRQRQHPDGADPQAQQIGPFGQPRAHD